MKLEANFSRLLRHAMNPGKKIARKELYVFTICLLISIFIWFLIALSKESYTSIEYPVKFMNAPADMVLVNKPDSTLTFRILSGGIELFSLRYLSSRAPIAVDLENISLEKKEGYYSAIFNTSRLAHDIRMQYRFGEELVSISPEVLYFRFEPLAGKLVPVVSNLRLKFQQQFRLSDSISFSPPEVKVTGPGKLLESIDHVDSEALLVTGIEGPVSGICRLVKPFGNTRLEIEPQEVGFTIPAERFTESTISIPVVSMDENVSIKSFPENVNVTFLVSLSNFKRIDPELFTAAIELPESRDDKVKAAIKLIEVPVFVEVTKIDPPEVDFLFLKK